MKHNPTWRQACWSLVFFLLALSFPASGMPEAPCLPCFCCFQSRAPRTLLSLAVSLLWDSWVCLPEHLTLTGSGPSVPSFGVTSIPHHNCTQGRFSGWILGKRIPWSVTNWPAPVTMTQRITGCQGGSVATAGGIWINSKPSTCFFPEEILEENQHCTCWTLWSKEKNGTPLNTKQDFKEKNY